MTNTIPRYDDQVSRIELGGAIAIGFDDVLAAVGQRSMDVCPLCPSLFVAEQHFQIVPDDDSAFGDDELSCDFLAYGHADIHAVGQRPVVGDLGVDLHLSVFVDRRVDRNDASLHFFAQIGERRDCNLLPPAELSVLGFEDGEADVEAPVVEQRTEFALGIFIEMLLHIRDLTGKWRA